MQTRMTPTVKGAPALPARLAAAAPRRAPAAPRKMLVTRAMASEMTIRFENGSPVLSMGGATVSGASPAPRVTTPEEDIKTVGNLFNVWNAALATLDPEKVASLYAPDGVLLPTVSNQVRTDHAGKVDYFTNFLKLRPQGVIDESHVRMLGKDIGIHSGVYTFTLQKPEGPAKVQARFTFSYKRMEDGEWKIIEHHSSAMPEPVVDPAAEVADQFNIWNAALATLDPEKVASLYAPDGVLLPTVSNEVRTDHAGKVRYFTDFLKLKPQGVIDESHVRMLSKDLGIHSGVYTFTLQKPEGPAKVQARFSFLYKKIDGKWKITEHHSSAMPEKPAEPAAAPATPEKELVTVAASNGAASEPAQEPPKQKKGWWQK